MEQVFDDTPSELVLLADHMADSPVTADHIRLWTRHSMKGACYGGHMWLFLHREERRY